MKGVKLAGFFLFLPIIKNNFPAFDVNIMANVVFLGKSDHYSSL